MQSALGELVTSKDFLYSIHLTVFAITVEQACDIQMLEKITSSMPHDRTRVNVFDRRCE